MDKTNLETHIVTGRKVFFINPNLTIFSENFCMDFMALGFECYFVMKDTLISMEEKINILVNSFKDIVLFFNIDAPDPQQGVSWLQFIKEFSRKYENPPMVGIIFSKRPGKVEEKVNFLYENEARATCGAYMLEFDKRKNFNIIAQALLKIGAKGRRKQVRVLCKSNCKIKFEYGKNSYYVNLADLSLSHFTAIFEPGEFPATQNVYIKGIEFNIKGIHFSHDASVLIKRLTPSNKEVCVFAFVKKNGEHGLDESILSLLLPKMYLMLNENFNEIFLKFYDNERKKNDAEKQAKEKAKKALK